jgi:hypothetical protein
MRVTAKIQKSRFSTQRLVTYGFSNISALSRQTFVTRLQASRLQFHPKISEFPHALPCRGSDNLCSGRLPARRSYTIIGGLRRPGPVSTACQAMVVGIIPSLRMLGRRTCAAFSPAETDLKPMAVKIKICLTRQLLSMVFVADNVNPLELPTYEAITQIQGGTNFVIGDRHQQLDD